jgi:hypothetical protein
MLLELFIEALVPCAKRQATREDFAKLLGVSREEPIAHVILRREDAEGPQDARSSHFEVLRCAQDDVQHDDLVNGERLTANG